MEMRNSKIDSIKKLSLKKLGFFSFKNLHFYILIIGLLAMAIIMFMTVPLNFSLINDEIPAEFNTNWQYSVDNGEFNPIDLPNSIETKINEKVTLVNSLPSKYGVNATLLLRTSQQSIKVYIDEELFFTTYNTKTEKYIANAAYHLVRLPPESFGKKITIEITSHLSNYAAILNDIHIGSKASLMFHIISTYGTKFILGFILLCVGMVLGFSALFVKIINRESGMTYLGSFFFCAGVWLVVESRLCQFFIPYPNALTNLSIYALTLMPVCASLYYLNAHVKRYKKPLLYVAFTMGIGSLLMFVVSLFDIFLPIILLPYYAVLIGMFLLAILIIIFLEYYKGEKKFFLSLVGLCTLCGFGFLYLIIYLLNLNKYEAGKTDVLSLGIFLFCIILFYEFMKNAENAYKDALSINTLKRLAYTDSLTGLNNRASFIEELNKIEISSTSKITIAMFDINNLKSINDNNGHLMGDYAIMECANFLSGKMKNNVYRIGGDEFVSIVIDTEINNEVEVASEWRISPNSKIEIAFAYGFATYSPILDNNLFDTYERADKSMYVCKSIQKERKKNPLSSTSFDDNNRGIENERK